MDVPPERIDLADVGALLRRHKLEDLDGLHRAIEESRDHLRPWMPWADQGRADTETFIATARNGWDTHADFSYLIVDRDDGEVLGGAGLHRRIEPRALEIGYWRGASAGGRGVITAAAAALRDSALALVDIDRVEIRCDEANVASAAIPRRLGFRLDRIEDDTITAPGEHGRMMIWVWEPAQESKR